MTDNNSTEKPQDQKKADPAKKQPKPSDEKHTEGELVDASPQQQNNTPTATLDEFSTGTAIPRIKKKHLKSPIRTIWQFLKSKKYFSLCVLLPWFICFIYFVFIVSPQYQSSASIVIEQNGSSSGPVINVGFLGQLGGQNANNDYLAQNFINSRTMLDYLIKHGDFEKYYQNHHIDWLSRLASDPSQQTLLSYYQDKVAIDYDQPSESLDISMRAFDAKHAKMFLGMTIDQTKFFVNKVANTLASVQYRFANEQLQDAKDKLYRAENNMLLFQKSHQMFDPTEAAKVISSVVGKLKQDLVKLQTQLITYAAYMRPNASQIVALKEQVAAVKQQIRSQSGMLLGTGTEKSGADSHLNSVLAQYEWVQLELKFAETEYTAADNAYQSARINLSKQQNIVVTVEKPNMPDTYSYPEKAYDLITIFIGLVIAFMLGKMIIIIVQEHRD